jgi:NAD(P)H-hydrate epimerase
MTSIDSNECCFCDLLDTAKYDAVAVGPGLGTTAESERALLHLIDNCRVPMVVDADALNIIACNPEYLRRLPQGSIITPHPGEFARLFGKSNRYISISSVRALARDCGITIVLKGAYTAIIAPDGNLYFNSTGNPGMATAGSGDVLAGILLSFLAQGYTAVNAARAGVYVHGLAGDYAAGTKGTISLVASDIVDNIPEAFKALGIM